MQQITAYINSIKINHKEILNSLLDAKNKLLTLLRKEGRKILGLINEIGSLTKWLFGNMDDDDR